MVKVMRNQSHLTLDVNNFKFLVHDSNINNRKPAIPENATTTISFDIGNKREKRGKESSIKAGNLQIVT